MKSRLTEQKPQKGLALILCFLLLFLYKETVWDVYFFGKGLHPENSAVADKIATASKLSEQQQLSKPQPKETPNYDYSTVDAQIDSTTPLEVAAPLEQAEELKRNTEIASHGRRFPSDAKIRNTKMLNVNTDLFSMSISLLGGRVTSLILHNFRQTNKKQSSEYNLISHVESAPYPLAVISGGSNDTLVNYELISTGSNFEKNDNKQLSFDLNGSESLSVVLRGKLPDGRMITKTLAFKGTSYLVDISALLETPAKDGTRLQLEWTNHVPENGKSLLDPYNVKGFTWFDGQKAARLDYSKLDTPNKDFGNVSWASLGDKYFTAALVAPDGLSSARAIKTEDLYRLRIDGTELTGHFLLFAGPKSYEILEAAGYELQRNIDFGKLGFISAPLLTLLHFFYRIFGNYGLAIIALTILVKLAIFPLTHASFKQMKAMQELQPEMERIRKATKDRQKQQAEMMELYKKRGVNPLGGCFPMVLQMPIFIGLYSALMLAVELRHAPFAFWIKDLSAAEKLTIGNVSIPVLVILFVISMVVQQWMTPAPNMDPVQRKMMLVMPIVFGFMFASFPAGLTLYWLTNNLISIAQQRGLKGKSHLSAIQVVLVASAAVFLIALILTRLS